MPAGVLVTVPDPAPAAVTVSVRGSGAKVADTLRVASIVTAQPPVPVQAPDHPVNVEFTSGAATSETTVEYGNVAEQEAPQAMPAGVLVTEPPPGPAVFTVNDRGA